MTEIVTIRYRGRDYRLTVEMLTRLALLLALQRKAK